MRPLVRSLLPTLLVLIPVSVSPSEPELAERERIGMDLRLGVLFPASDAIGTGLGYGAHLLFIIPGRFQGEIGVDFSSSSQDPLAQVSVPGWRLREATSKIDLIPITLGVTCALGSRRLYPFLGMGVGWLVLNEHIEAVFVDTGYILTTRKSFGGAGPAAWMAAGLRYVIGPRFSLFWEAKYLGAWVDYRDERLDLGGPVLNAGIRF